MAKAYYGSRFSPNMTQTPEGFLICHNVPIARTGWYQYLGEEISPDLAGKFIRVYRSPEDVFEPAAIASFEGKPLTDEHPPEWVSPDNATVYTKGFTQNVRQGSGDDSDLLIADLLAMDRLLIEEIMAGKREVSAGYDLVYVDMGDGTFQQRQIRGNHVAVVKAGRAGDRVSIKDSETTTPPPKGDTKMSLAKKLAPHLKKNSLRGRATDFMVAIGLKEYAKDAEPDEMMEAVDALAEERGVANDEEEETPTPPGSQKSNDEDPKDPAIAALEAKVDAKFDQIAEMISKIASGGGQKDAAPEDAIDAAIAELGGQSASDNDEEESHTIPTESLDEKGPVTNPEDRPQSAMDNAYKIEALRALKPVIAAIKDPAEKKRATDAAIASIKGKPVVNTYAQVEQAKKQNAATKQQASDQKAKATDHADLGQRIAEMHNPHYKKRS